MLQMLDLILESIAADGRGNIAGQFDLFGFDEGKPDEATLVAVPDVEEFDRRELMAMEKEMTGLYLSGHPMDEYRDAARRAGAVPIGPILEDFANEDGPQDYIDGQRVTLAGVVESSRTRTTKNGTLMAYIQLEDDTGTMELLAFQRALDAGGGYVAANAALLVTGRISVRDEKEPQLMVGHHPAALRPRPRRHGRGPAEGAQALAAAEELRREDHAAHRAAVRDVPRARAYDRLFCGHGQAPGRGVPHPPLADRRAGRDAGEGNVIVK